MKSNFLQELELILEGENGKKKFLPIPNYIFVQKYGRSIESEMTQIAKLLGKKEWFVFKADQRQEKKILDRFLLEQECKASVGREYTGCVLVELTGTEEEKELAEFLDYIEEASQRLTCIYTTKQMDETERIKNYLMQYGFVRMIEGESYKLNEQLAIFEETVFGYQFSISGGARIRLAEWLHKKDWQEQEKVCTTIQNMAKSAVYQKILTAGKVAENKEECLLGKAEIEAVINEFDEKESTRRPIGFSFEA